MAGCWGRCCWAWRGWHGSRSEAWTKVGAFLLLLASFFAILTQHQNHGLHRSCRIFSAAVAGNAHYKRSTTPLIFTHAGGLLGLLGGIRRGAIGVVVLPLASLLEMLASTADSIRRAVAGSSNVGWVRPPRWVLLPWRHEQAS